MESKDQFFVLAAYLMCLDHCIMNEIMLKNTRARRSLDVVCAMKLKLAF